MNPEVTRLKLLTLMNDRCLEMQKKRQQRRSVVVSKERGEGGQARGKQRKRVKASSASCPFYRPGPLVSFGDLALVSCDVVVCSGGCSHGYDSSHRLRCRI